MSIFRPTKGRGGMGGYQGKPSPKPMKAKSTKARSRDGVIHQRFEEVLQVQERHFGSRFCLASLGHPDWKHACPSLKKTFYPLVPDHVETRNGPDADRRENLQGLCTWCNYQKGSVRVLDFRPSEMVKELKRLDEKEAEEALGETDDLPESEIPT